MMSPATHPFPLPLANCQPLYPILSECPALSLAGHRAEAGLMIHPPPPSTEPLMFQLVFPGLTSSHLSFPPPCLRKTWDRGDSGARCGERRDYLVTGAVLPLTPVGAQAGGEKPLGLSPGGDGDRGAGGAGGEGPAGEEGVGQV